MKRLLRFSFRVLSPLGDIVGLLFWVAIALVLFLIFDFFPGQPVIALGIAFVYIVAVALLYVKIGRSIKAYLSGPNSD
jgi:hypothetical protein